MSEPLVVSIGPHIKDKDSTKKIMWAVTLALVPAGAAGIFIFGIKSLFIIISGVLSAVVTEAAICGFRKKEMTIGDGSAVLTGLLLAYNLPPGVPLWLPVIGAFFAVAVGKQVFGGLGHNIFNPALTGRAFLMLSWPAYMTTWQNPRWLFDAVSRATPLAAMKEVSRSGMPVSTAGSLVSTPSLTDLLMGNRGGCIGEVCVIVLILGAGYLLAKKYITWHVPVIYIATTAILSWMFNGPEGLFKGDVLFFMLSGGLVLGAFFMATDYITSPLSSRGKVIFGIGCGALTFVIRRFAGYPEGVSYAILIMNAAVPVIDRYTFPKWFGAVKK
ncbi:MAG: RnfABCDGE type electron transport complex subunit D [Candidatus Omnitrophica bacterium]|nr:RnfABCDGE type electron transport complex subunit D [Candidatus Omnitrophota bacterium]